MVAVYIALARFERRSVAIKLSLVRHNGEAPHGDRLSFPNGPPLPHNSSCSP
jgi:hypothetical protein